MNFWMGLVIIPSAIRTLNYEASSVGSINLIEFVGKPCSDIVYHSSFFFCTKLYCYLRLFASGLLAPQKPAWYSPIVMFSFSLTTQQRHSLLQMTAQIAYLSDISFFSFSCWAWGRARRRQHSPARNSGSRLPEILRNYPQPSMISWTTILAAVRRNTPPGSHFRLS